MNSKIIVFILSFMILFMGLNIYAENNKVILKKFEVRGKSNNFNSEKYYNLMKDELSQGYEVLDSSYTGDTKNFPIIINSFQFIDNILIYNLFLEKNGVVHSLISRRMGSIQSYDLFVKNISKFLALISKDHGNLSKNRNTGEITFLSIPKKIPIFLNGIRQKRTDYRLEGLPLENKYNVILYKVGYLPYSQEVILDKDNKKVKIAISLTKVDELENIINDSSNETKIKEIFKKLKPPKIIKKAKPIYPLSESVMGNQGTVKVVCTLDDKGNVIMVKVYKTNASKALNNAALKAAKKCKFTPAYFGNEPFAYVDVELTYKFVLSGRSYEDFWKMGNLWQKFIQN